MRSAKEPTEATQGRLTTAPERRRDLRPFGRGGCQLDAILESFLSDCGSAGTRATYRSSLMAFIFWWHTHDRQAPFSPETLQRYRAFLLEGERGRGPLLKPRTVALYLAALRRFCRWLIERRLTTLHPAHLTLIRGPRIGKGFARDSLTEEELRRLLRTFPTDADQPRLQEVQWRNYAIAVLWSGVGLRSIEIVRARRGDLTVLGGEPILRVHRKGRETVQEDQFVVLKPWVLDPLRRYLELHDRSHETSDDNETHASHPLFAAVGPPGRPTSQAAPCRDARSCRGLGVKTIQNMMRRHLGLAGLRHQELDGTGTRRVISPHSLRHSAASLALEQGASPKQVQDMLGHAHLETTMLYLHNKARIRQAAEGFIPPLTDPVHGEPISGGKPFGQ